jgi:hypothetical protein
MGTILTGELISTEKIKGRGELIEEVGDDTEKLDEVVYDHAESIPSNSPVALEFDKTAVKASPRINLF